MIFYPVSGHFYLISYLMALLHSHWFLCSSFNVPGAFIFFDSIFYSFPIDYSLFLYMNGITSLTYSSLLKCWQLKKVLNLYISASLIFYFQLLTFIIIFINIYFKNPSHWGYWYSFHFVICVHNNREILYTNLYIYSTLFQLDKIWSHLNQRREKKDDSLNICEFFPLVSWAEKKGIAVGMISFHRYYGTTHSKRSIKELSPEDLI